MDRRTFVASTGALIAGHRLSLLSNPSPLLRPPRRVDMTLTARRQHRSLAGSSSCNMFTWDNDCPGPVVELREGDRARLVLQNRLD
jgi:FtsP/CotA-like multicopper oxidase with cupredoxin domain